MASFRSRVFRFLLSRTAYDWSKPLPELRQDLERNTRLLRTAKHVKVSPVEVGDIHGEWIRPANARKNKAMLYLHGGGYIMGSCNTHRALVSRIAKAGRLNVLLIDYRLAPEHPFPAALEDSTAAYMWLQKEGFQSRDIVFAGDSAGGGLVMAALVSLRDNKQALPCAAVCLSPWTDLAGTGESVRTRAKLDPYLSPDIVNGSAYAGNNDLCLPLISPHYADLAGLPPLLIHVGTDEILLNDSTRLAENAAKAGISATLKIWDNMWHVFHAWAPMMPEADRAIGEIGVFVNEALARGRDDE